MSEDMKKRLIIVMDACFAGCKQAIFHELEIHHYLMDESEYLDFMHLYIAKLSGELMKAKLTMDSINDVKEDNK